MKLEALVARVAKVELAITVDEAACRAAKATVTKRLRTVNRLRAQVRKAKGKAKTRLRRSLSAAQKSHRRAVEKATAAC